VVPLLLLPGCSGCRNGLTSAHPTAVPDSVVVLVRDGTGFGAFVPLNQQLNPESVDYAWFFRTSSGVFSTNDPEVQFGIRRGATNEIRFARFAVPWSGCATGYGWLYYPRNQHGVRTSTNDWQLCVTAETNPAAITPRDPRWRYRSRPPLSWEAEKAWLKRWWD